MDCVNHSGATATAYCQNCGKPLCAQCVRATAAGQILCEPCSYAWRQYQQPIPPPPIFDSGPNPSAAAVLGVIPGVGAMYNGQFFKGLVHVVVFVILVSLSANINGIFGIFIAAWVIYQSFEAFHTARALRDGLVPPDPLGLNELHVWLGGRMKPRQAPAGAPFAQPNAATPPADDPLHSSATTGQQPPYAPYESPYQPPSSAPDPAAPCQPRICLRRNVPVGAVVLIALGLLFLLDRFDLFHGRLLGFLWPIILIVLGLWLVVQRISDSKGGSL
jgi:TM2 domain-containing membrane protein YozV